MGVNYFMLFFFHFMEIQYSDSIVSNMTAHTQFSVRTTSVLVVVVVASAGGLGVVVIKACVVHTDHTIVMCLSVTGVTVNSISSSLAVGCNG